MPYQEISNQTAKVGICPGPRMAQELVAGLDGSTSKDMRLYR